MLETAWLLPPEELKKRLFLVRLAKIRQGNSSNGWYQVELVQSYDEHTRVWWQIEISQILAFFSTHISTLQQLLEDLVEILFHISNRYPHFFGGSQKCTQSTPPVKVRNSQKV